MNDLESGFSLIEVMVTSVLFFMATGILFGLFHKIGQWRSWEQGVRDVQRQSLLASAHLGRSLSECSFASISATYVSGNPANGDLVLSAVTSRDNQGQWRETDMEPADNLRLVYFVQSSSGNLVERKNDLGTVTPILTPLSPGQMLAEILLPETRVLGRDVESFSLTHPVSGAATDEVTSPLSLQIRVSGTAPADSRSVQRTITFVR